MKRSLFAALSGITLLGATALATPLPPPPGPSTDSHSASKPASTTEKVFAIMEGVTLDDSAPRHQVNQSHDQVIDRIVTRGRELKRNPSAGVSSKGFKDYKKVEEPCRYFCNPSAFAEYYYLRSDDDRIIDTDSYSSSGSVGFDFTTVGDLLVGFISSYTYGKTHSEFLGSTTWTDSYFVNLYVAKPLTDWLTIGVTAGYGHVDAETKNSNPTRTEASDSDSWTGSPFISLAYANDAFFAAFTTSYLYSHTASTDTGKLNFKLGGGYNISDMVTIEAGAKYVQEIHDEFDPVGEDAYWLGAGAKLSVHPTADLSIYLGYDFEFNDDFQDHTGTAGVAYSF